MRSPDDSWADDGRDDCDSEWSDSGYDDPLEPEDWTDLHSELLVTLYHTLRDEGHLTGILDHCSLHELTGACYKWSTSPSEPSGVRHTGDEVEKNFLAGLWKTCSAFRNVEKDFLRYLDENSFLHFCGAVSSQMTVVQV